MKTLLLTILSFLSIYCSAQSNFVVRVDSSSKSKSEIYSDTKIFISENFKLSKIVVDDANGGMILISDRTTQYKFCYSYMVKFLIKDHKYQIIINDVRYKSGPGLDKSWDYSRLPFGNNLDNGMYPGYIESDLERIDWMNLKIAIERVLLNKADSYIKYIQSCNNSNQF